MVYRTRTYIAADWDGDNDLVSMLQRWNAGEYWSLSFPDAHELTQARDTSKACSIKKSLHARLDASKTFVLIVGKQTSSLRKGSCQYCPSYTGWCHRGYSASTKSFIEYECEYAVKNGLRIVVLYNMSKPERSLCPEAVRWEGIHLSAWRYDIGDRKYYWDYQEIRNAIMK
ncbi:MAG: molecular chaperone Tir [Coriobacteriia bacterium]|nr:molecular chaperone Tir [Coriobacteriia bacterium]